MKEVELRDYLKFLTQNLWLILGMGILGVGIALFFSAQPKSFESSTLIYIAAEREKEKEQFSFEGFYASERARNFTDTAFALLSSDEFQNEIFGQGKVFVKKIAPQLLRVSVKSQNPKEVLPTIEAFIEKSNAKITKLGPEPTLKILPAAAINEPKEVVITTKLNVLVGLLLGLVFGIVATSFLSYLRGGKS